jgi:hypothetical protein
VAVVVIAVGLGLLGLLAFPVVAAVLVGALLIASPLIYFYVIQDRSESRSEERPRRARNPEREEPPTQFGHSDRQVRAQAKRIRGKCKRLRREAKKVGGVYANLTWHSDEMRRRAEELADAVIRLRDGLREIERSSNPTLPPGASPEEEDERLRSEYDAVRKAQARLDSVVERNRQRERICLAQLERIEDLVDAARLELTHPATDQALNGTAGSVAEELETELELSRQALREVRDSSELQA